MANPTQLGSITGEGVGTQGALEAMRCVVELDGGREAGVLGQVLSRQRSVSGGAPALGVLVSDTWNVLLC